jgi:carbon-monoxide dehydrogenase medium subunit
MYEFTYHKPATLNEASSILKANDEAKILAGGMTLIPTMKMRLARPSDLVDLAAIEGLSGIKEVGDAIEIGAMTRHADVAGNALVQKWIPALAELADGIGDAQVRNRGTLGGSLANSDPAADYPAAVLALGAVITTDRRQITADEYFKGLFTTALGPNELLLSVRFPKPVRAAYAKLPNPASRYAIVGVMVAETAAGIRLAVTGAGACAYRDSAIEAALGKAFSVAALDGVTVDKADLNSDLHASAAYRAHLVVVMARRAVQKLSA